MDPHCFANGTCPWGPGVDPNSLALFSQYPAPNGFVAGDGLNTASFTWSAPNPLNLNTSIGRIDYTINEKNRLFVRGNLQDDTRLDPPQFPGQPASNKYRDNTKGIAAGEIWSPTANFVNNARYGYTRQGFSDRGIGQGSYVDWGSIGSGLPSISSLTAETRSSIFAVPVQNFIDDVSWTKGNHTAQFGVNYRLVHNQLSSDALSYDSAAMIGFDVTQSGFAGTGQSFDPGVFKYPTVDPSFVNSYNFAVANLAGIISQVTNQYNYAVSKDGASGSLAPQGAFINHDFKSNEFEYYAQDSWRATHKLTITFGLRHTLLQTPYEIHGQQVQTTTNLHDWFETRGAQAALGISDQPALSFAPSGQARGLRPYWPMDKANLAPRLAIAYAPDSRTSIRAGFGMFYDHFGQSIVNSFSQYGSYGLQGQKQTPNDALSPDAAPRLTSRNAIPQVNGPIPASISYPYTPSTDPFTTGFATAIGLDDKVHTPYSYTMDLSVQRELPQGFSLEVAYVGRLGRHLLQQMDLATPLDLVDPASGQDFYQAATVLTKEVYAGATTIAPVAYFENLFPDAANGGADGSGKPGNSATQNIFSNLICTESGECVLYPVQSRRAVQPRLRGPARTLLQSAIQFALFVGLERNQQLQRSPGHFAPPRLSWPADGLQLYVFEVARSGIGYRTLLRAMRRKCGVYLQLDRKRLSPAGELWSVGLRYNAPHNRRLGVSAAVRYGQAIRLQRRAAAQCGNRRLAAFRSGALDQRPAVFRNRRNRHGKWTGRRGARW